MNPLLSKSSQLRSILRKRIASGCYAVGTKLPSEKDLASEFKVSHATVREAVSQLVEAGQVRRVQGSGSYVRKAKAAQGEAARTVNIYVSDPYGLMERDLFYVDILCGIHSASSIGDKSPLRLVAMPRGKRLAEIAQEASDANCLECDAIFTGCLPNLEDCEFVAKNGIRAASVGMPFADCPLPFVEIRHFEGAFDAVRRLAEKGRRKIAMSDMDGAFPHVEMRRRGFDAALKELSCEGYHVSAPTPGTKRGEEAAELARLLDSGARPDALICVGDRASVAAFRELSRRGMKTPSDMAFVSYSNYDWIDDACQVKFAKVRQDVAGQAKAAFQLLKQDRTEEGRIWMDARFEEGETC